MRREDVRNRLLCLRREDVEGGHLARGSTKIPLRNLLQAIFKKAGFTLLVAEDGQEAAQLALEHDGTIDLLVSNVQMPHVTGPDLAKALKKSRPDLRVLLISGYPQGLLMLDNGWSFLQKPFSSDLLARTVRDMLDAKNAAARVSS